MNTDFVFGRELGRRIRYRLLELNKGQKWLAEKLRLSDQVVSQYVKGVTVPPADRLVDIATLLNMSVDELVGHSSPTPSLTENGSIIFSV